MMSWTHKALTILLLSICSSVALASQEAPTTSVAALIKDLQSGGHIIYMRHAPTARDQKDSLNKNFDDCSTQRNLSDQGRLTAEAIGLTIERLSIPIGNVYSSPYCRCKETAQLTFQKYSVEMDLQFSMSKDKEESQFLGRRLKSMMLKTTPSGENTVFVGHTSNLREGLGVWPKPEGVWSIFKKVDGQITYKGMIKPDAWPTAAH